METQKETFILLSYKKIDDNGAYLVSGFLVNYPLELIDYSVKLDKTLEPSNLKHFIEIEITSDLITDYVEWGMNYVSFIKELLQDSSRVNSYETIISKIQKDIQLFQDREEEHLALIKKKDSLINSLISNNYHKV